MATAHLIHGFLCCGKTTFAKDLERRTNGVRISLDEWLIAATGDDVYLDPAVLERIQVRMLHLWPEITDRNIDVILDFGFWRRRDRDRTRDRAMEVGAETRLYWVRCADDIARRRCVDRDRDIEGGDSFAISEQTFDEMRSRYEPLSSDEEYELVETSEQH